jgi:hypothetical protein
MTVRQFSRRHFVGGVAAAVGAMGLQPDAQLLAQGQTQQFTGSDADYDNFVKLASNENNWGPPDSVMKAMNSAWKYANRYGYPDGNVMQVIADHHGVRRDNILLTAGSGEGLNVMATTYLGPGKKVLGVSPSYASVFQQAANVKADSIQLPLTKDYRQDIGQMIEAANRNARDIGFVYMCNPNNPTGAVVTAKEIKDLLDNIPKDMPVLIDEAYHHYVDDPAYGTAIPYVLEGRKVVVAHVLEDCGAGRDADRLLGGAGRHDSRDADLRVEQRQRAGEVGRGGVAEGSGGAGRRQAEDHHLAQQHQQGARKLGLPGDSVADQFLHGPPRRSHGAAGDRGVPQARHSGWPSVPADAEPPARVGGHDG